MLEMCVFCTINGQVCRLKIDVQHCISCACSFLWIISGSKGDIQNNHHLPLPNIFIQGNLANSKKKIVSSIIFP